MKNVNKLDYALLIARVFLGTTMAAHGTQKLFGWFGGYGFEGTMGFFTETIGLPYVFAAGIILLESVGMVALMTGLFTRFFSATLIAVMLGAIATVHAQFGFFMDWEGNLSGEGFEFHLLVIALSAIITIQGAGALSFDNVLFRRKAKERPIPGVI